MTTLLRAARLSLAVAPCAGVLAIAPTASLAASQPQCDATGMLCVVAPVSVSVGKTATFEVSLTNTSATSISGDIEGGSFLVVKGNNWDWQYDFVDFTSLAPGSTVTGSMKWKITYACNPCEFPFRANIDGWTTVPQVAVWVPLT
jgi:hypothetical protein